MANVLGVENLKLVINFGMAMTKQTQEVLEDKKVKIWEIPKYLDELLMLPGVAEAWPQVKEEWKDGLNEQDLDNLQSHFAVKFDIPNDEIEFWIEDALGLAVNFISLVNRFKELKKKKNEGG